MTISADVHAVAADVARVEARTGARIVTAVVRRSDAYAELAWKAFALGASLGAFVLVIAEALHPAWTVSNTAIVHALAILGTGGTAALLAEFVPPFARLFLRPPHAAAVVRRHAESLFVRHGLQAGNGRSGVLLLISRFERRIEIVADTGAATGITAADWEHVLSRMTPILRREGPLEALREALAAVDDLIEGRKG
jgi:putative membrane protein